ncbi:2-amino-4-hydroxy-6-hydroxymethyldihydropteridine diphosphokinase [Pseudomonas antarctica]|uniref:2-amino-4-hydroxy-6- hydroxymethyldihydropteridine diphosphokinase n=1 Tax=Pseudomonas antarctica TaxID=219572 RepID=UPI00345D8A0A
MSNSITQSRSVLVYLGLGSNFQRNSNIRAGLDQLSLLMTDIDFSPVFVSEAVGIETDLFFNMVMRGQCELSLTSLIKKLKDIETSTGRRQNSSDVSLDIDILLYGDEVGTAGGIVLPNAEIHTAAHVLYPLAILARDEKHPVSGIRYSSLWAAMDRPHRLWPIPFEWRGIKLTPQSYLGASTLAAPPAKQPVQYVCGQAVY